MDIYAYLSGRKYLILRFKSMNYFCYSIVLINIHLEIMLLHYVCN